jgi:hypothetical protein
MLAAMRPRLLRVRVDRTAWRWTATFLGALRDPHGGARPNRRGCDSWNLNGA